MLYYNFFIYLFRLFCECLFVDNEIIKFIFIIIEVELWDKFVSYIISIKITLVENWQIVPHWYQQRLRMKNTTKKQKLPWWHAGSVGNKMIYFFLSTSLWVPFFLLKTLKLFNLNITFCVCVSSILWNKTKPKQKKVHS